MYDLIAAGSVAIDFYFEGSSLTFANNRFQLAIGGKYVSEDFQIKIGGGAVNVAIGVTKAGLKPAILGTIGDNIFKPMIFENLRKFNISYKLCDIVKNYYNLSAILLTKEGERSIIHFATPCQKLFDHGIKISYLRQAKMVYLGNLPEVSLTEKIKVLKFLRKNSITNVVNLGVTDCRRPKSELEPLLKHIDILIINGHEFADLVKAAYKDIYFHEDVVAHYIPTLHQQLVIITEGSRGSFAYYHGKVYHQKAFPIKKIIDTTGAGDGYTAGFIAEYFRSKDIKKAMENGAKYAAKILGKIGAN